MKEIPLTKGAVAIVDDCDYDFLSQWKWYLSSRGYAMTSVMIESGRHQQNLAMTSMIWERYNGPVAGEVDHENQDKLDNRRGNLRLATHAQNGCNRGKQKNNTSGFKGVSWNKSKGKWCAQIWHRGKKKHLGYFFDKIQAALAYDKAATKLHGTFACCNRV